MLQLTRSREILAILLRVLNLVSAFFSASHATVLTRSFQVVGSDPEALEKLCVRDL